MNNQDTTSPFKKDCPELELHSMLGDMKSLGVEFEKALDAEESEFNALADAAYRAKEQIREASRKTVVKVPKLVTSLASNPFTQLVEPYPIGTKIAAFFKSHEAHGLPKPKKGSRRAAPGRVYDGQVKGMEFDAYKLRMYVCEFNTPASNTLRLKESFVTPMVEAYQSEHEYVTSDGLSSPDTNLAMPNVSARICQQRLEANTIGKVKTVIVGSNLCRWFPGDELATWCDDSALSDATGGQWIEGTVVEIGKRNKKKNTMEEANCCFDAPVSGSLWFSLSETIKMGECYAYHKGMEGSEVHVFQKGFAPIPQQLCKGTKQKRAVQEASAVSARRSMPRRKPTPCSSDENDGSGSVTVPLFRKISESSPDLDPDDCDVNPSSGPHESGALSLVTTLGYRLNMSSILQLRPSYCVPLRCHGCVIPFKVLHRILEMLEGSTSTGRTSDRLAVCVRLGVLYKRHKQKVELQRFKVNVKATSVLTSRLCGRLSLVTTLGYRINMSSILVLRPGFCATLQFRSIAIPFKILPSILEMLESSPSPALKAATFAACVRLSVLYKRLQLKWDQQRRKSNKEKTTVPPAWTKMTLTSLPMTFPITRPLVWDNHTTPIPFAISMPPVKAAYESGSGAIALLVSLGLRLNMSAIVMRPHLDCPLSKEISCGKHLLTFDVVLLIIALLHGDLCQNLRADMEVNSRILQVRFDNIGWDPQQGYQKWDDGMKQYVTIHVAQPKSSDDSAKDTALSHTSGTNGTREQEMFSGMTMRNCKQLPMAEPEAQDKAVRSMLDASLKLRVVTRDGNCMFRALAYCYGRLGWTHATIRKDVVDHVVSNWNSSQQPFGEYVRVEHPDETSTTYHARMLGRGKDWGDYPELVAAAMIYQRHINVLQLEDREGQLSSMTIEIPGVSLDEAPTVVIVRVGHNHYHAGTNAQPTLLRQIPDDYYLAFFAVIPATRVQLLVGEPPTTEDEAAARRLQLLAKLVPKAQHEDDDDDLLQTYDDGAGHDYDTPIRRKTKKKKLQKISSKTGLTGIPTPKQRTTAKLDPEMLQEPVNNFQTHTSDNRDDYKDLFATGNDGVGHESNTPIPRQPKKNKLKKKSSKTGLRGNHPPKDHATTTLVPKTLKESVSNFETQTYFNADDDDDSFQMGDDSSGHYPNTSIPRQTKKKKLRKKASKTGLTGKPPPPQNDYYDDWSSYGYYNSRQEWVTYAWRRQDEEPRPTKKLRMTEESIPNNRLRNWTQCMRRNFKQKKIAATMRPWILKRHHADQVSAPIAVCCTFCTLLKHILHHAQAYDTLATHGICVIEDFFTEYKELKNALPTKNGPAPVFSCSKKQATYITKKTTPRAPIFNGVRLASKSSIYKTHESETDKKRVFSMSGSRMGLAHGVENHDAMLEYHDQMDLIIKMIFPDDEYHKNKPENWLKKCKTLWVVMSINMRILIRRGLTRTGMKKRSPLLRRMALE